MIYSHTNCRCAGKLNYLKRKRWHERFQQTCKKIYKSCSSPHNYVTWRLVFLVKLPELGFLDENAREINLVPSQNSRTINRHEYKEISECDRQCFKLTCKYAFPSLEMLIAVFNPCFNLTWKHVMIKHEKNSNSNHYASSNTIYWNMIPFP